MIDNQAFVTDVKKLVDSVTGDCYVGLEGEEEIADRLNKALKELASAPVAGEATNHDIGALWAATPNPGRVVAFARALLSKYAAPQASEAVRDVQRYQWLREGDTDLLIPFHINGCLPTGDLFDAAVDAAIEKQKENNG